MGIENSETAASNFSENCYIIFLHCPSIIYVVSRRKLPGYHFCHSNHHFKAKNCSKKFLKRDKLQTFGSYNIYIFGDRLRILVSWLLAFFFILDVALDLLNCKVTHAELFSFRYILSLSPDIGFETDLR